MSIPNASPIKTFGDKPVGNLVFNIYLNNKMVQVNLIFTFTLLVIIFRYVLTWIWGFAAPDIEVMITMLTLAVFLKFGEEKGKKVKDLLDKLKKRFSKKPV